MADDKLKQIIDRAIADGVGDEDIDLIVQEHQKRNPGILDTLQRIDTVMPGSGGLVSHAVDEIKRFQESPGWTAASYAIPGMVGKGMSMLRRPAGELLKHNGAFVRDAVGRQGALGLFGRMAETIGEKLAPTVANPNAGGSVRAGTGAFNKTLEQELGSKVDDIFASAPVSNAGMRTGLKDLDGAIEHIKPAVSHGPSGNTGGRLVRRPGQSMTSAVSGAARELDATPINVASSRNAVSTVSTPASNPGITRTAAGASDTVDDLSRLERLEKYGLNPQQQKVLDTHRQMAKRADAEVGSKATTSRIVEKAKQKGGKAVAQAARQNAESFNSRIAQSVKPVASHTPVTRVPAGVGGDEYQAIRQSGGPFNPANMNLTPEERAVMDEFWEEIAIRGM